MTLEVLHERSGVLAIAKPAGIATQAPRAIASVEAIVREHLFGTAFDDARANGQRRHPGGFLGVLHRLDRPVSGVLLLATTPRAARQLSRQFERRQIQKTYLALVSGPGAVLTVGQTITWRDTIRKLPDEPRVEIVPAGTQDGHEAVTEGCVLALRGDSALVALEPHTGRMHQLRVQAAARGMPVVGDVMYGGQAIANNTDDRSHSIALHAWRIEFLDPDTAVPAEVTCPPPSRSPWDEWAATISQSSKLTPRQEDCAPEHSEIRSTSALPHGAAGQ